MEPTAPPILRMEGVSKRYGGVRALENADLAICAGRIHAILGENGAGKSTLIKILSGVVRPDAGRIVLDGAEVAFDSPAAANRAGIVCIFQGLSLIYISHRMHEIAELADECTVFRNGSNVESYVAGTKSDDEVVEMMIGRELSHVFPTKPPPRETSATPLIEVKHLNWADRLRDISFHAHGGEVVGLGGLDGQGQRELLLALFGVLRGVSGEIRVAGAPVEPSSPNAAKSTGVGMALIPEDRKTEGLVLPIWLRDNLSFASLERISRRGVIDHARETERVGDMIDLLAIRASGTDISAGALSGGNQQKVVIAKWLMAEPRIILLNDPTRGIDVATKQEIYQLLRRLADSGAAIIFYTTDYAELIGCCDRALVLYDGAIKRVLAGDEITERALISSALNIAEDSNGSSGGARPR